jgi:vacuolar-type H+-ATPase catalytic subunit A/Vma1
MPLMKMWSISFTLMFLLVFCSVTLAYYGLTKANVNTDGEAERVTFRSISSAVSGNIQSVSEKVRSNASRLSDIFTAYCDRHIRTHKSLSKNFNSTENNISAVESQYSS